jgi:hypothetical protein
MIQYSWLGLKAAMGEQMKFRTPHTFTEIKLRPDQSRSNHPDVPGSGDRPGVSSHGKFSGGKVERNLCHPLSSRIQKETTARSIDERGLNRILVRASLGKDGGSTNLKLPSWHRE